MNKTLKDFRLGVKYTFIAAKALFNTRSLWVYALLPWLLGLCCYLILGLLLILWLLPLVGDAIEASPDASAWWSGTVAVLRWLSMTGIVIAALAVFLLTYTTVSTLLSLPFLDLLAEKYEEKAYGIKYIPQNMRGRLNYYWTSSINSSRINLKGILWAVLLIPVWLTVPGGLILSAPLLGYYLGLGGVLYGAEHRRCPYRQFKQQSAGSRAVICGMGTMSYLCLLIPFAAFFMLPVLAIGGVMIYNDVVLPRRAAADPAKHF